MRPASFAYSYACSGSSSRLKRVAANHRSTRARVLKPTESPNPQQHRGAELEHQCRLDHHGSPPAKPGPSQAHDSLRVVAYRGRDENLEIAAFPYRWDVRVHSNDPCLPVGGDWRKHPVSNPHVAACLTTMNGYSNYRRKTLAKGIRSGGVAGQWMSFGPHLERPRNKIAAPAVAILEVCSAASYSPHPVTRAVPSALRGLASGFGMGPGVSLSL